VVSDGIVEQFGPPSDAVKSKEQFELQGVREALASVAGGPDIVVEIFRSLYDYAGTTQLADDATVVCLKWE